MFGAGGLKARALTHADLPALQCFFDANPEYALAVQGVPPPAAAVDRDFNDRPPPHLPYDQQWTIGFEGEAGALAGSAVVLSDFIQPGVWHIGLFILATVRHGTGQAMALYEALEGWMRAEGAQWVAWAPSSATRGPNASGPRPATSRCANGRTPTPVPDTTT